VAEGSQRGLSPKQVARWAERVSRQILSLAESAQDHYDALAVAEALKAVLQAVLEASEKLKLRLPPAGVYTPEFGARVSPFKGEVLQGVQVEYKGNVLVLSRDLAHKLCQYTVARPEFCEAFLNYPENGLRR